MARLNGIVREMYILWETGQLMLTTFKNAALVAVVGLGLSACAGTYFDAKDAAPSGDAYSQALYKEVMIIADFEAAQEDWVDANYHASRALAVANGESLTLTPVANRSVAGKFAKELGPAHDSLAGVLAGGAAAGKPGAAARAVAGYECWLEQAEEGHQLDHIAACKDQFNKAIAELVQNPAPALSGPWTLYFPTGSSAIDFDGQKAINAATDAAATGGSLIVQGHADAVGLEESNLALSKRRTQSVVVVLNLLGINSYDLTVGSVGESQPLVPTADGVPERENRVVVMRLVR
jgi:OOP family OmpA-OmpF porin